MSMNLLSNEIVEQIKCFIENRLDEEKIKSKYPNTLLREDILSILDEYCTIVYFPLEGETINGFHVTGLVDANGSENTFVYINTAQTIEKQVFTAAHELGHIWGIDEFISSNFNQDFSQEDKERIINRFAAELLMPERVFVASCILEFDRYKESEGAITIPNILKAITNLMSHFFVPYKSVLHRIYELKIISEESALLLHGDNAISYEEITQLVNQHLKDSGNVHFLEPTRKCWIDGLSALLDQAEKQESVSQNKINHLRELFGLAKSTHISDSLDKQLNISLGGCD